MTSRCLHWKTVDADRFFFHWTIELDREVFFALCNDKAVLLLDQLSPAPIVVDAVRREISSFYWRIAYVTFETFPIG